MSKIESIKSKIQDLDADIKYIKKRVEIYTARLQELDKEMEQLSETLKLEEI